MLEVLRERCSVTGRSTPLSGVIVCVLFVGTEPRCVVCMRNVSYIQCSGICTWSPELVVLFWGGNGTF